MKFLFWKTYFKFNLPVNSVAVDGSEILEHVNESSGSVSGCTVKNSRDFSLLSILFDSIKTKRTISSSNKLRYIIWAT